jgi:hypothetical protein
MGASILRKREGCSSRCDDKEADDCISHDHFSSGAAVRGAGDVSTPSVGHVAAYGFREKAPHEGSVAGDA